MHTVEYACISCTDDIDLLKIGQKKRKYGMNALGNSFTKLYICMWFWHSDIDCPDKITNKSRQG